MSHHRSFLFDFNQTMTRVICYLGSPHLYDRSQCIPMWTDLGKQIKDYLHVYKNLAVFFHFSSLIHFDHIYKLVQECNRNGSHPLIGVICHLGSPHQPARHQNCAICVVIPSGKSKTAPIFPMSTQHNINFKMWIIWARH